MNEAKLHFFLTIFCRNDLLWLKTCTKALSLIFTAWIGSLRGTKMFLVWQLGLLSHPFFQLRLQAVSRTLLDSLQMMWWYISMIIKRHKKTQSPIFTTDPDQRLQMCRVYPDLFSMLGPWRHRELFGLSCIAAHRGTKSGVLKGTREKKHLRLRVKTAKRNACCASAGHYVNVDVDDFLLNRSERFGVILVVGHVGYSDRQLSGAVHDHPAFLKPDHKKSEIQTLMEREHRLQE